MPKVTISSKFQIVIPKEVREALKLRKGESLLVVVRDGLIALVPDRPLKEFRGYLKGMPIEDYREEGERL